MLMRTDQTLEKFCIALFNSEHLDRWNMCPGNHDVAYEGDGIFYLDGEPVERADLAQQAEERFNAGEAVLYSSTYNSYVLSR